jgi:hypothetical protein
VNRAFRLSFLKWLLILASAAFWIAMNVLLWRAEFRHGAGAGSTVPPAVIWRKILAAPDLSSLTILRHGKKIGSCRWTTSIAEELSGLKEDTAVPPQDFARKSTGFRLQLEGSLNDGDKPARIRFEASLLLSTNQLWREFKLMVNARPAIFDVRATAADQAVRFSWDDGKGRLERVMSLSDLGNPAYVLEQLPGWTSGKMRGRDLLLSMGQGSSAGGTPALSGLGLNFTSARLSWEGSNDELRLGHSSVRVYRLRAHLVDRYEASVYVSRVGEILRVDLPDQIVLLNEQFVPPS